MKKYILALSIGLFSCVPSENEFGTTPTPEKYSEYCRAVEDRLKLRRCEVGYDFVDGTTFETFCKNLILHGVDINPLCLMEIRDCDQIDVCTGSIHDRKKDKLSSIGVDSKVVLDQIGDPSYAYGKNLNKNNYKIKAVFEEAKSRMSGLLTYQNNSTSPTRPINGFDLIAAGFSPGILMGKIFEAIDEELLENPELSYDQALDIAKKVVANVNPV